MSGILSYGVYLPYWRLRREAINEALGSGRGKGTRRVASYDEDTTSMGVEAARVALRHAPEGSTPAAAASRAGRRRSSGFPTWTWNLFAAHTIGTIGLRLSAGGTTIADVVPPTGAPLDRGLTPGPRVDPCGFRIAVANAWADHRAGRKVGLVGWDGPDRNELGERLTVTWAVGAGAAEVVDAVAAQL